LKRVVLKALENTNQMLRAKCSLVINYDLIIAMKAYKGIKYIKGIKGGIKGGEWVACTRRIKVTNTVMPTCAAKLLYD